MGGEISAVQQKMSRCYFLDHNMHAGQVMQPVHRAAALDQERQV